MSQMQVRLPLPALDAPPTCGVSRHVSQPRVPGLSLELQERAGLTDRQA